MEDQRQFERMATLEADLNQIKLLLTKLDSKFDNLSVAYVPRAEIDEKFKSRDEKINILQNEVTTMKVERQQNKALAPAWIGVIVAIAALIVPLLQR